MAETGAFDAMIWQIWAVPYAHTRRKPTIKCPKLARLLSCPPEFPFQQAITGPEHSLSKAPATPPSVTGHGQRTRG